MRQVAKPRKIRLRYAGLVNFTSNIASALIGLMFITMASRNLSEAEFGSWHYLTVLAQYFILPATLTNYWLTRYAGRGFRVARTGFALNTIILAIALTLLAISSPFTFRPVEASSKLHALLLPALSLYLTSNYYYTTSTALALGVAPQAIGYSQLLFEAIRTLFGFILILKLDLGIVGVLAAVAAAYLIITVFLIVYFRDEFGEPINRRLAVKWVKLYWLPAYSIIALQLMNFDVILMAFKYSSIPVAHMRAIQTVIAVMLYSTQLYSPLYAILLGGGSSRDVEQALSYFLMFAIPMAMGIIAMPKTLLSLLKAPYAASSPALIAATLYAFALAFTMLFSSILRGIEDIELHENITLRDYVRSKLFYVPTRNIITYTAYLITLYAMPISTITSINDPSTIAFLWVILKGIFTSLLAIQFYRACRRELPFKFPLSKIAKYVFAAMLMFLALMHLGVEGETESFIKALRRALMGTAIGASVYFAVLILIEPEVRQLIRAVIGEAKQLILGEPAYRKV